MRKRVSQKSGDLWMQLPQDVRSQIKDQLPILILAEQELVYFFSFKSSLLIFFDAAASSSDTLLHVSSLLLLASNSQLEHGHNSFRGYTSHVHQRKSRIVKSPSSFYSLFSRASWKDSRSICKAFSNYLKVSLMILRVSKFVLRLFGAPGSSTNRRW